MIKELLEARWEVRRLKKCKAYGEEELWGVWTWGAQMRTVEWMCVRVDVYINYRLQDCTHVHVANRKRDYGGTERRIGRMLLEVAWAIAD